MRDGQVIKHTSDFRRPIYVLEILEEKSGEQILKIIMGIFFLQNIGIVFYNFFAGGAGFLKTFVVLYDTYTNLTPD